MDKSRKVNKPDPKTVVKDWRFAADAPDTT
jgi:hypothetical protein